MNFIQRAQARELEDLREEAERLRQVSPEQRGQWIASLAALAVEQISSHPNARATLNSEDELPSESALLLKRLREKYKRERTA